MIGDFLLGLLKYNDQNEVVYSKKLKFAQFKIGDIPLTFRHNNAYDTPEYFRICDRAYKVETVRELLDTLNPDVIDGGYSTALGRANRDRDAYDLVASGRHAQWVAMKYNSVPVQAVHAAIARHADWLTSVSPAHTKIPAQPQYTTEEQLKANAILAYWADADDTDPPLVPQQQTQPMRHVTLDADGNECFIDDEGNITPIDTQR